MTILQLGKQKERIEKVIYTYKKKKKVHPAPAAVVRTGQNQKKKQQKQPSLLLIIACREGRGTSAGSRNFRKNMHLERVGRVGTGRSTVVVTCTWSRCTEMNDTVTGVAGRSCGSGLKLAAQGLRA